MAELEPLGDPGRRYDHLRASDMPGLARVLAGSSFRVGAWAAATGFNAGRRVVDVALHPDHAPELVEDLRSAAAAVSRALVGEELEDRVRRSAAGSSVVQALADATDAVAPDPPRRPREGVQPPLRAAGQELLRRSRDVWADERGHPAYSRIIEELAPDEARILLLLVRRGSQPTLDVRTGGLLGTVSSDLVAANLNMIGPLAGCRYLDRVPSYLHNLERLGLVWFSSETLRDPEQYQVLEAQPDVLEVRNRVRRSKVVRRSIHLTPFGEDFCRDGLGLDTGEEVLEVTPPPGVEP